MCNGREIVEPRKPARKAASERHNIVVVDSARSANFNLGGASLATVAVKGSRVGAALCFSFALQPDISALAPSGAPAVADNPEIAVGLVRPVANKEHQMVEVNVRVV